MGGFKYKCGQGITISKKRSIAQTELLLWETVFLNMVKAVNLQKNTANV